MIIEAKIGNTRSGEGDGSIISLRGGKTGELIVGACHAEHYESVIRQQVYSACTAVGGVAHGTSLSTTAAFWLHNPINSGKNLVLIAASMGYISGTLGGGSMYLTTHDGVAVAVPSAGTVIAPRPSLLGSAAAGVARAFTTATVATQVPIRPVWNIGPMLATSVYQPSACKDSFNGEFIVPPGFGVGLHAIATAGSTPLVTLAMSWEEVPLT